MAWHLVIGVVKRLGAGGLRGRHLKSNGSVKSKSVGCTSDVVAEIEASLVISTSLGITERRPIHDIITEMLKTNPRERISSSDVVIKISNIEGKKRSSAYFLIDRPLSDQTQRTEDVNLTTLMNCLRYRLRIPTKLISGTQVNNTSTNSRVESVYDTLMQVIDQFDATGIVEIYRLLLERRSAVPLFLPQSKLHFLGLLRHVTLPRMNNISMGDDKSLMRVAVISCRQRNKSQTCDFLKNIFNINSIYSLDLDNGNFSSENMLAEIGCGCIVTEESGSQIIQNVLVVHVMGDFRPLWPFLRRFADCFLIEDSSKESESFFSSFMTKNKRKEIESEDAEGETKTPMGFIWKPSIEDSITETKEINGFPHLYIEDQLTGESRTKLKFGIVDYMNKTSTLPNFANNRLTLYEIPILVNKGYYSDCVSPTQYQSKIGESVRNLENVKKNKFLLQKNFLLEVKHQEAKMEHRLNEVRVRQEEDKIKILRAERRNKTRQVETNSLLKLFLSFLDDKDPCSRVLTIRMLEKELTKCGEQELDQLLNNLKNLTNLLNEKLVKTLSEKELQSAKENLLKAKVNLIESVLNMKHLWRELSHLYTDTEPGKRSPIIQEIPRLAAQHLMDGFCLELVDGDSNMIRLDWMKEVLFQLDQLIEGKRIFVLSVMGIQSSGKSTLLNTMFGIKMRTSVGQCTRGVNMQLLAVQGRPEYDYILLLDTEGTRSPEFHGVPGNEKRDNQMATLSILMSDASIVVIPGENDAAVKEILPIVLMAYKGSELAEENGGRLSSRMFFVYNRIDTQQKKKLDSIIQTLGTLFHEAFRKVQKSIGNESTNLKWENPFSNFNLISSDSSGSDVCILGNVNKQTEPPGDVPDEKYGEELIQLREHIHRRVTNVEGKMKWKSRSICEFSSYIKNVWDCICSANFDLSFATVLEHTTFDDKFDNINRMRKANKLEAAQTGPEMDTICNKCQKSLDNMRVNVDEKISTDEMIQLLKDGTKQMGELQKNWAGMTMYFTSINSYIKKVMKPQHQVYIDDANAVLELGSSFVDLLTDSMAKSLESSIKSHRTATTYFKVSDNYIMGPLKQMHRMLALRPDEVAKVQDGLKQSCKNAVEGIQVMFHEETQQTIQQVQNIPYVSWKYE
uniref:VLIG-type G domain-containing protein n=1 Tax=Daphnia galeata TaxID=27404 RepID=A0A8J2S263_9CRUS|nr:unnamed protein product [Daphnia galeata]